MMAYLIVAHHQPEHLARLIRALDQENSCFFIHIDQKAAIEPFETAVPQQANIMFLRDRVPVRWGDLSVVLAVLKLLGAAVASNLDFKYYTLLSGSDYPIKDRREIHARLEASDRQFIRIDRKLVGEPRNAHFWFIERLPQGTYFGDLIPYHGSMYWSLTADCVRFILAFLNENPGFIDLHQYVFAPDEIFFHSIVKASPFAEAIVHDFERGTCPDDLHHANHYIDWAGRRRRENLTLDERDFEDLLASEALFARKFHQERSRRLLDLIDDHVHRPGRSSMKLLVLIGTDYHLGQLPHFLRHYHRLGVDGFLCGLHGRRIAEARRILADYPVEIVAEYGDADFKTVCADAWKATFNLFRRQHVRPDEWCLYADVDEFHEYPPDFFAALDPRVNAVLGTWVERLATPDGQLRACRPDGNLGEQFPFATREIFCGMSYKVMATRGGLDVAFGYHYFFGDAQVFSRLLNVHHFRWDDQAAEKYRDRSLARNDELRSGRVPDLHGVFAVDPPFPAAHDAPGPEAVPGPARCPARLGGEPPAVSCICLTYGRPEVLEEAIHSFLQQDYVGPKELIVLNDYDKQILEFDHPEVLVVNLPKRLRTVGETMNLAVSLAAHDLLFVWADDGVYLPHRLTLSVANLEVRHGFFKPDKAWFWNSGTLRGPGKELLHSGSCWTRRLFDEVRGYPAAGAGNDSVFEQRLERRFPGAITAYDIRPEDIYSVQRHTEQEGIRHGRIRLSPHWNDDYRRLVADCLRSQPTPR